MRFLLSTSFGHLQLTVVTEVLDLSCSRFRCCCNLHIQYCSKSDFLVQLTLGS